LTLFYSTKYFYCIQYRQHSTHIDSKILFILP